MTEAGIILPMKTARGLVKDGKVKLVHPLPEGQIVYVRLLTDEEKAEDAQVMDEVMAEMEPFKILSAQAYESFERHSEELESAAR